MKNSEANDYMKDVYFRFVKEMQRKHQKAVKMLGATVLESIVAECTRRDITVYGSQGELTMQAQNVIEDVTYDLVMSCVLKQLCEDYLTPDLFEHVRASEKYGYLDSHVYTNQVPWDRILVEFAVAGSDTPAQLTIETKFLSLTELQWIAERLLNGKVCCLGDDEENGVTKLRDENMVPILIEAEEATLESLLNAIENEEEINRELVSNRRCAQMSLAHIQ